FLAKATDESFDQFHAVLMLPLPDAFAQFGAAKDAAGFAHKHAQKREFSRRQIDSARTAIKFSVDQIQNQIADLKLDGRLRRETSPERTHSRDQLLHRKWLSEVIIRAEGEAANSIAHFPTCGQDNDTSVDFCRS